MAKLTIRIWILIIALVLAALMISPTFKTGVVIKSVEKNSTAFNQGIKSGMIIKEINGQEISSLEDYSQAISTAFTSDESRIDIKTENENFVFLAHNLSDWLIICQR